MVAPRHFIIFFLSDNFLPYLMACTLNFCAISFLFILVLMMRLFGSGYFYHFWRFKVSMFLENTFRLILIKVFGICLPTQNKFKSSYPLKLFWIITTPLLILSANWIYFIFDLQLTFCYFFSLQLLNHGFQGGLNSLNNASFQTSPSPAGAGIPLNSFLAPNITINNGLVVQRNGGFKLALGEDGRLVLQHDPTLNQDLQSQLLLQSIFGLNGGLVLQPSVDQQMHSQTVQTIQQQSVQTIQQQTVQSQTIQVGTLRNCEPISWEFEINILWDDHIIFTRTCVWRYVCGCERSCIFHYAGRQMFLPWSKYSARNEFWTCGARIL